MAQAQHVHLTSFLRFLTQLERHRVSITLVKLPTTMNNGVDQNHEHNYLVIVVTVSITSIIKRTSSQSSIQSLLSSVLSSSSLWQLVLGSDWIITLYWSAGSLQNAVHNQRIKCGCECKFSHKTWTATLSFCQTPGDQCWNVIKYIYKYKFEVLIVSILDLYPTTFIWHLN